MLDAHKLKLTKILDHMTTFISPQPEQKPKCAKWGLICSIFNLLFGSGDSNSEIINQIKRQLEMVDNRNVQISQNRAVLNMLIREKITCMLLVRVLKP